MRKLLILSTVGLASAVGCCNPIESLRRVEVWKQQTWFAPPANVQVAPSAAAVCGGQQVAAPCANPCATPWAPGQAAAVTTGMPVDSDGPTLTEESDRVLEQP